MNSIILCEGIDDLWFVGYYLNKVAGWDDYSNHEKFWKLYQPHPLSRNSIYNSSLRMTTVLQFGVFREKTVFHRPSHKSGDLQMTTLIIHLIQ